MRVAIATKSPEKIAGIIEGISRFFNLKESEIEFVIKATNSGVSSQPFGDETYQGALNRLQGIRGGNADYYISCEAGIEKSFGQYFNVQVVCILEAKSEKILWGKSSAWLIPSKDIDIVRKSTLDTYLRGKGLNSIEEMLGDANSRRNAVAQATEIALASNYLNK